MLYYVLKISISAILITVISEVSKKYSMIGGILASLPIVSILAITWLYLESQDLEQISQLSMSIFWMVIPSLFFFIFLVKLIEVGAKFGLSMGLSIAGMIIVYYLTFFILKRIGGIVS